MTSSDAHKRHHRLTELFEALCDLPAEEQRAALIRECDDAELREEVAALIGIDLIAPTELRQERVKLNVPFPEATPEDRKLAEFIGPYRVLGVIGSGGMGTVYKAEQTNPRRRVALKVLNSVVAVPEVLRRFEHEAHILGLLQHPGIAQIIEAGTFDNEHGQQPFFAMEFVEGETLSGYAKLTTPDLPDRLRLFASICDAVHHAHQRGVIHRDLKPANILVTPDGIPKVLDFGVARVTQAEGAETMMTVAGQVIGTLGYMSPEQAEGDPDLDTGSDVYSLGVVLYEFLSGEMPYEVQGKTFHDALKTITDTEAQPLSQTSPHLRGDVETIVHKALRKESHARYASAEALAADLRRFLGNEPVAARNPTTLYYLSKFARRHRALAASIVVGALVLVIGLISVSALSQWALAERKTAKAEARRADENATDALRERNNALRERNNVLRLSDSRRLRAVKDRVSTLWPAVPQNLSAMDLWLEDAQKLLANLPDHERKLAELRSTGTAHELPAESPEVTEKATVLAALRESVAAHEDTSPEEGREDSSPSSNDVVETQVSISALEAELAELLAEDTIRRQRLRDYDFGDDEDTGWWHDALRDLVIDLCTLQNDDRFGRTIASVEARRSFASTVTNRTLSGPDVSARWVEARHAIRTHARYNGLNLMPQLGLIPLGPDPESTLWEFWHVESGASPKRDEATGRRHITDHTGLILVLIPGGKFWMGAQKTDPRRPNFDPAALGDESNSAGDAVQIEVPAFFLSKYELTQGQWAAMTGANPSQYGPGTTGRTATLSHPVERVSWNSCAMWLPRYGLRLPTESQWERGARGDTSTPWWTGADSSHLDEAGNVADSSCSDTLWSYESNLDDGYLLHATVGLFRANGLGLHDVIGNVLEWCEDEYSSGPYGGDSVQNSSGTEASGTSERVLRGGSFYGTPERARSAFRVSDVPDARYPYLGVRPARSLEL